MPLFNINVENEINVTFVTYYEIFNCNICNISVEKIYIHTKYIICGNKREEEKLLIFFLPIHYIIMRLKEDITGTIQIFTGIEQLLLTCMVIKN